MDCLCLHTEIWSQNVFSTAKKPFRPDLKKCVKMLDGVKVLKFKHSSFASPQHLTTLVTPFLGHFCRESSLLPFEQQFSSFLLQTSHNFECQWTEFDKLSRISAWS